MRVVVRWIALGLVLVGCGAARGPTVYRPGMAPWQVYEASRKRCSKEDAPVTVDDALRARLAPHLDYPRFIGGLAPDKLPANVSEELDSNYRAIGQEGDAGRRVVREALLTESAKKPPSSFFLLDMGHFLVGESCPDTAASAVAYAALDPKDPIVQVGSQAIPKLNFQAVRDEVGGGVTVKPASELRERFARMIEDLGRDDSFEPSYVLDSDLPRAELIEWLRATRAAQLRRQSNEALSDVKITNSLILALSLRER